MNLAPRSLIRLSLAVLFVIGSCAFLVFQMRQFVIAPVDGRSHAAFRPAMAPEFVRANVVESLEDEELVVGVAAEGVAKAYPLRLLAMTEHLNDALGSLPVVVSWCPLTGSAVVFDRRVDGQTLTFRFNHGLYQGNLLLDDIETDSVWNQLTQVAVDGTHRGTTWRVIPSLLTTWGHWRARHPETLAIDLPAGEGHTYRFRSVSPTPDASGPPPAYERVLGVTVGDLARAYPFNRLAEADTPITETIGGERLHLHFESSAPAAWATDDDGNLLPATAVYWNAWQRFHPETTLWSGPESLSEVADD